MVPALRDRNWWLNNIASGTDTSRLFGLIHSLGREEMLVSAVIMIMRNFSPTKYITQQKTASRTVVGHYSLTICTNWLLKQWTKSCHTHTQSQAHGCCRIQTLQRPSVHSPGQLWENKSWYSSRWCSSSTDLTETLRMRKTFCATPHSCWYGDGVMVGCDISGCRHTITAPPGCWLRDTAGMEQPSCHGNCVWWNVRLPRPLPDNTRVPRSRNLGHLC